MIVLNSTFRSIKVVLGGAVTTNQLDCTSQYIDSRFFEAEPSLGATVVTTNNTTSVTVVPAPTSGVNREIFTLTVYNKDTASATVTLTYTEDGTDYIIAKATLSAGDTLAYTDRHGWTVHNSNGDRKTA
jgi:hypothetical protein